MLSCHYGVVMVSVVMPSRHYGKCRFAECRGARKTITVVMSQCRAKVVPISWNDSSKVKS